MNEREFAHKLAVHLSASARAIDGDVAQRLRAARGRALGVQRRAGGLSGLFVGGGLRLAVSPGLRSAGLAAVLLAVILVGDYWATWTHVVALEEVDTALLIDDLPIDAYLDTDFKAWVQQDSRS